eukprot:9222635-Ditylum_brightwellii.AAC.1
MDVTINGGVTSLDQLETMQKDYFERESSIDGIMAGRWCLRRPLDLVGIEALLQKQRQQQQTHENINSKIIVERVIEQYVNYAIQTATSSSNKQQFTMAELCLPLFLIIEHLKDDYEYYYADEIDSNSNRPLLACEEIESLYTVVLDGVQQMEEIMCPDNGSQPKKKKKKSVS